MPYPILIVDDDPQMRKLLRLLLVRSGWPVVEATNGGNALGLIKTMGARISALLTDIEMDGVNGIELARTVTSEFPTIPVLFISSKAITAQELKQEVSGSSLLLKPFTPVQLLEAVLKTAGIQPLQPSGASDSSIARKTADTDLRRKKG